MDRIEERLGQLIDEQHGVTVMLSQKARNRYIQRRDALRNEIAADFRAMVEALEEVEWAGEGIEDYCPCCGAYRSHGHMDYCEVGAVLARAKGGSDA